MFRELHAAVWPLTMVGLDVTEKTVFARAGLNRLAWTQGRENDFAFKPAGPIPFAAALLLHLGHMPNVEPLHFDSRRLATRVGVLQLHLNGSPLAGH